MACVVTSASPRHTHLLRPQKGIRSTEITIQPCGTLISLFGRTLAGQSDELATSEWRARFIEDVWNYSTPKRLSLMSSRDRSCGLLRNLQVTDYTLTVTPTWIFHRLDGKKLILLHWTLDITDATPASQGSIASRVCQLAS